MPSSCQKESRSIHRLPNSLLAPCFFFPMGFGGGRRRPRCAKFRSRSFLSRMAYRPPERKTRNHAIMVTFYKQPHWDTARQALRLCSIYTITPRACETTSKVLLKRDNNAARRLSKRGKQSYRKTCKKHACATEKRSPAGPKVQITQL